MVQGGVRVIFPGFGNGRQLHRDLSRTQGRGFKHDKQRDQVGGIYVQAATQAYDSGDYATALYSAVYANVFGPSNSSAMTLDQLYSSSLKNINNATVGTWPSQFAIQSEFYFRQSVLSQGAAARGYAEQAYSTSKLAVGLEAADSAIVNSFLYTSTPSGGVSQQVSDEISDIQQNISQIYWLLLFDAVMMFVILVILLFHLLSGRDRKSNAGEAFRNAERKRKR